jgi:hypothetical protein
MSSAQKPKTGNDKLLGLIINEAERQIKNMEPLRNEADVERFKFHKFGEDKMVKDVEKLVAVAKKAVELAQEQEKKVQQKYQTLSQTYTKLQLEEEKIPALQKELKILGAQIELTDVKILQKKTTQIDAVLKKLKEIQQLTDINDMLRQVVVADQTAEINPNLYGTYVSAFAKIPRTSPKAALLSIYCNTGFKTQVQSCIPCTARAFVADFLRQHGDNPSIQKDVKSSHAIRLIGEGGTLLEMLGIEQVQYNGIHVIFVKEPTSAKPTDVAIPKAGETSKKLQDGANTNECNKDHLNLIKQECISQIKSLTEQQKLLDPQNIDRNRIELEKARAQLESEMDVLIQANEAWEKTKQTEKETLNQLEQRMDDMDIRTKRFLQQQNEAMKKLNLYKNEKAAELLDNKFEALDNVVQTLIQIVETATQEREGTVHKGETLAFIKDETGPAAYDTQDRKDLQYVYDQIPTTAVGAVNVNVRVWTPNGIKKYFPSLCVPCGLDDLIDALKTQNAQDTEFVESLTTMTPRLIIEGKVANGVPKNIVKINSIDVVLHKGGKGEVESSLPAAKKHRVERGSSSSSSGGGKAAEKRRRKSGGSSGGN